MRKISFSNAFLALVLAFSGALLSSCSRHDDTVVLKLAHVLDTAHAVHQGMVHMAERLDHYSDGTMRIDIYPSGQLGAERDTVELACHDQGFRRPAGSFRACHASLQHPLRVP
jgi:TRAP-type C4-dicarboxylate transport system substrate-binding protein